MITAIHPDIRIVCKYVIIVLAVIVGMVSLTICVEVPGAMCEHLCCRSGDHSRRARRHFHKLESASTALWFALLSLLLAARDSLSNIASPASAPVFAQVSSLRI